MLSEKYQAEIDTLNKEIEEEGKKLSVSEDKGDLLQTITDTVTTLANFKEFDESVTREVLEQIMIYSKAKIDVYLRGLDGTQNFFSQSGYILDNKYLYP